MHDEPPRLVYNPEDGSLYVQTIGPTVTVEGIAGEVAFERMLPDGETVYALWLSESELDVLRKMIAHILARVAIRAESQAVLESLLPRIDGLLGRDGDHSRAQ